MLTLEFPCWRGSLVDASIVNSSKSLLRSLHTLFSDSQIPQPSPFANYMSSSMPNKTWCGHGILSRVMWSYHNSCPSMLHLVLRPEEHCIFQRTASCPFLSNAQKAWHVAAKVAKGTWQPQSQGGSLSNFLSRFSLAPWAAYCDWSCCSSSLWKDCKRLIFIATSESSSCLGISTDSPSDPSSLSDSLRF